MELVLQADRTTKLRLTLLAHALRVEEGLGPVQQQSETPYDQLNRRPPRLRDILVWLSVSLVLLTLPLGMAWVAVRTSEAAYYIATVFLGIPALLGLLELFRSFRDELIFNQPGLEFSNIRFTRTELRNEQVRNFVQELENRIAAAKAGLATARD